MKSKYIYIIGIVGLVLIGLTACSITKHLPEGEVLYRGIKEIKIENKDKSSNGENAWTEAEAALACAPNNAILGSSSLKFPLPVGLWMYNKYVNAEGKFGKWMFNRFAAKPVLMTAVNPELRAQIARNILHDYGYFNGTVDYEVIPLKSPRRAKINYYVDFKNAYKLDSIAYLGFPAQIDSFIQEDWNNRLVRRGKHFNVIQLDAERQRISNLLRDKGYYYFRSDFITFRADTLITPGAVHLQIIPKSGIPKEGLEQWRIGRVAFNLSNYKYSRRAPVDSLMYKDMMVYYTGKRPPVRPSVLYRRIRFHSGELYSQQVQSKSQDKLNRLGVFRFSEFQYVPRDTLASCDRLDVTINAAMDQPLDGELEMNITTKSNDQVGPGASFSVSRRNIFRGGETFSVGVHGSYEWQTKSSAKANRSAINSYELGVETSLDFPWVVFPWVYKVDFDFPATSTFRIYGNQLNRAGFFKMLSFGGNATYNFQPSAVIRHSITPFRLTFNALQSTTARFDSIMGANRALYQSLKNQFIPAMSYTYTYDDTQVKSKKHYLWWQTSITSAGNITSGVYAAFGNSFHKKNKKLMGNPFAQFVKLTSEVRYNYRIDVNNRLAMRLMAGAIYSYGNMNVSPYSEQFFVGGATSIRAFTVRALGPGSYHPAVESKYSYIDQTGDFKLEANLEYRFRILGDLHGAVFLDAGNVWLLREDVDRPGGKFDLKRLGKDIALGTGMGIRYDLTFLVLRFDVGVGLHVPYETGRSGYYNLPSFKKSLGYHLAIGYPF